jgi:hypothetical protein
LNGIAYIKYKGNRIIKNKFREDNLKIKMKTFIISKKMISKVKNVVIKKQKEKKNY